MTATSRAHVGAVILLILVAFPSLAFGHGCMVHPPFRGTLKTYSISVPQHEDLDDVDSDSCPHCLNGGGKGAVTTAAKGKWTPWDPINPKAPFRLDTGLCGDPISASVPRDHEVGGKFGQSKKMPYVAVYKAGDVVEFVADVTTNHNGFFEFFLCDLDKCPGGRMSEKCFRGGHCRALKRVKHPECESMKSKECGPVDPAAPGRWYVPCRAGGHVGEHFMGGKYMKYKLPKGFSCKHCVIQWYWATANSCNPPGFKEYFDKYPMPGWGKCPGDGGAFGGRNPTMATCGGSKFPEEFWMCADVRITGDGVGLPAIMPRPGKGESKFAHLLDDTTKTQMANLPKEDDNPAKPAAPEATPTVAPQVTATTAPMMTPNAAASMEPKENPSPMPQSTSTPVPTLTEKPSMEMPHQEITSNTSASQNELQEKKTESAHTAARDPVSDAGGCGPHAAPATCVKEWGQCGGKTHKGPTECCDKEAQCVRYNDWHSMCVKPQHEQ